MFGATPLFISIVSDVYHVARRYYPVITVVFCYCTVSVCDIGNCNMVKNAAKCHENAVMLIVVLVLALVDSLMTNFKSLSLKCCYWKI